MKHIIFALFLLLTSAVSAQDKMPDEIRNYAKCIIDNGQSLEQEEFGKDGKRKDSHTGFKGVEYYRNLIDKELQK